METEIWKDVVGFEGIYKVSNFGRVKSLQRVNEIILKPIVSKQDGRKTVRLHNGIKRGIVKKIYRLVAIAFLPNPENKLQVNHIDGDHTNDVLNNLEWATRSEDRLHAYKLGLSKPMMKGKFGKDHHTSVPVYSVDSTGNEVSYEGLSDAARKNNVTRNAIFNCLNGLMPTCVGKKWYYQNSAQ